MAGRGRRGGQEALYEAIELPLRYIARRQKPLFASNRRSLYGPLAAVRHTPFVLNRRGRSIRLRQRPRTPPSKYIASGGGFVL
jgi:hypothetical protein